MRRHTNGGNKMENVLKFYHNDEETLEEEIIEVEEIVGEDETPQEKLFTQAAMEKIIGERLARDRKKAAEEAEKQRLLDEAKYKELYEASEAKAKALQEEADAERLERKKAEIIMAAGYDAKQVAFVQSILKGDDEAALLEALEVIKLNIPPTTVGRDPGLGNHERQTPEPKKDSEYGKELFDRIKRK